MIEKFTINMLQRKISFNVHYLLYTEITLLSFTQTILFTQKLSLLHTKHLTYTQNILFTHEISHYTQNSLFTHKK